jgi:putative ABC transport system permease protein
MRAMAWVRRTVGTAAGGTLALALLVCGCVFAAMAGPALSLHARTQGLRQVLAGFPSTTATVQVGGNWEDFSVAIQDIPGGSGQGLSDSDFRQSTAEIASGLAAVPLPLAGGDWISLTTRPFVIRGKVAASVRTGAPAKMEVSYRDPFTGHAQLVAGSYRGPAPPGAVAVAASTQTAAQFGLHPGSRLTVTTPTGPASLFVTAIIRERAPASSFWAQDSTVVAPVRQTPQDASPYWIGGVIADPGQFAAMQQAFGETGMLLNWEFPLAIGGLDADQAQGLSDDLNRATTVTPTLTGTLAPGANALTVTSPLIQQLSVFLSTQNSVATVLLLLFTGLIMTGAAVILLAARMIVARRETELTMLRARGGSLRQVAGRVLRGALLAAGPGVLIGAGLAITAAPGNAASSVSGWSLAAVAVTAALAGPPLIAAWKYRKAAPAISPALIMTAETGRPRRAWRRPVAEATAIAIAVAGLIVLHDQGLPGGGGIDLYLTAAPVLMVVPVVLVMLRLYPVVMRGLLALSARGAGATGFVALSAAARSSLTGVLPAFALVLALNLATFAGMIGQSISRGQVASSWQATGADVLIRTGPSSGPASAAAVSAIAAVPGVHRATAAWVTDWTTLDGQPVTVTAVDPAGYAALVAGTPFPAFPAAALRAAPAGTLSGSAIAPVLASPSAAALLGRDSAQLSSLSLMGPFTVRVAGVLSSTPAQPGGGTFVVMPLETLPGQAGQPAPNIVLVTGSAIDEARLSAVANRVIPGNITIFRSAALAQLRSSPLQRGAGLLITLTIATAAAFGLFIVVLGLALGAGERELTLARLNVMGHQRTAWLVLTEAMPAVLAAVAAGAVCAVLLPRVIGSSIDLSVFTGSSAPVPFQPDATAVGLPAAAIVLLALAALAVEARTLRRPGVIAMIRAN